MNLDVNLTMTELIHSPVRSWKEPLPPPREELKIDITCSDAELFQRFFCPSGQPKLEFLGDMWFDVPWSFIFQL